MQKMIMLIGLMIASAYAAPAGFSFSQLRSLDSALPIKGNGGFKETSGAVKKLGELSTLHAVGLATNPKDEGQLIYADETSLYSLDKNTGESELLAGRASSGLLAMRTSIDGVRQEAAFKYITKIIARPTGLFIFDYDTLRKYDFTTQQVSTVSRLDKQQPEGSAMIGAVSFDEKKVYWSTTSNEGHLVMSMDIGDESSAKFVTGGPTQIGHLELSADGEYILLANMDMAAIEKVKIDDGEVSTISKYSKSFIPGAMTVNGNTLYAINRDTASIDSYDISEGQPEAISVTTKGAISNPFDIVYDENSKNLFVLDGAYHPSLPTYKFSIKSISLAAAETGATKASSRSPTDLSDMIEFYSKWFNMIRNNRS